jgi:DNA-binding protein H-NS
MNLQDMTPEQLETLHKEVGLALLHAEKQRVVDAKTKVMKLLESLGVTVEELFPELPKKKSAKGQMPDRYISPDDSDLRWSGHGRRPRWFLEQLEKGVTEKQMEI